MVYDQAQSSRLGQRLPIESTFVQSFDVNPDTSTPDLPEAAYPGQLIFRKDLGILNIWDEDADTWLSVAGGPAGQHTYVSPEAPDPTTISLQLGDQWYDSDMGYMAYVWNGTSWQPSSMAADNVTGGTFLQDIHLQARLFSDIGSNGEHVEFDHAGLRVYGPGTYPNGVLKTDLNADGTQMFRGGAEIDLLTTTQSITVRTAGQLSRGGVFTLNQGVTAPGTAPSVNLDWAATPLTGFDFTANVAQDMCWDSTLSRWVVFFDAGDHGQSASFTAAGAFDSLLQRSPTGYSSVVAGTRANHPTFGWCSYFLDVFNWKLCSNLSGSGQTPVYTPVNTSNPFTMAWDGTNVVIAEGHVVAGSPQVQLQRWNPNASLGSNLVTNGTFESNVTGWSTSGASSFGRITGGNVINGTGSAQISFDNTAIGQMSSTTQFTVTPRANYTIGTKLHRISGSGGSGDVFVDWYTSGGTYIQSEFLNFAATSTLQTLTATVAPPINAAKGDIYIQWNKHSGTWVVDDITVQYSSGLNLAGVDELSIISAQSWPANALYIGNGDFGAKQYVVASTALANSAAVIPDSTKTETTNQLFPLPKVPVGIGYDGTSFWTLGTDNTLYKHEGGNAYTTQPSTWYATTTYRDTVNGYETVVGPSRSFTMRRRGRLTVVTAPINTTGSGDPNAIGYYLARKTTAPLRTDYFLQSSTSATSLVVTTGVFIGTNPPAASGFPIATNPGEIASAGTDGSGALIQLWGDGHWRLGSLSGDTSGNVSGPIVPTGSIMMWATATPPTGWLICNGQSTTGYPALAAVVGATVPDMRGLFPIGAGGTMLGSGSAGKTLGTSGGADQRTISSANLPNHTHDLSGAVMGSTTTGDGGPGGNVNNVQRGNATNSGNISPITNSTGNGGFANNPLVMLNPYLAVNFIIKT